MTILELPMEAIIGFLPVFFSKHQRMDRQPKVLAFPEPFTIPLPLLTCPNFPFLKLVTILQSVCLKVCVKSRASHL